jgi:FKBP-type peptidyl-prolyl cis-trans isomerase SlyD
MFPEGHEIQVGQQYHAADPNGNAVMIVVVGVTDTDVQIDGNHPLAGMKLDFSVKVEDVREATKEEIEHGHVHGPGGHQHD